MGTALACPHCGAAERLGVWLPPVKLHIFDRVARSGSAGVARQDLQYRGDDFKDVSAQNVRIHIWQINEMLEETDWAIRGKMGDNNSRYRLVKVR